MALSTTSSSIITDLSYIADAAVSVLLNATAPNGTNSTTDVDTGLLDQHNEGSQFLCPEGVRYVSYIADVVVTPPIVLFGVIGNILSFIVMCAQKPFLTTTLLLRYLAVIDTLILLAAIPLRTMRYIQYCHDVMPWYGDIYSLYIFVYVMPLLFVLRMVGTWLTTLLTLDRYIAVCKPLHAQRLITLKGAYYQTITITVCSVILSLPNFFEFHYVKHGNHLVFTIRDFATSKAYVFGYKIVLAFLMMYIIPMAIMVIFNANLVLGLRSAAKEAKSLLQRSVSNETSRLSNSITAIVVGIVVTFIICNTLALVSHTLYSITKVFDIPQIDTPRRYITQLSNIFVTLNSAINFLIYCVCSRSFRATFVRVFTCKDRQIMNRKQKSRQSNGSGNTYFSLLSNGSNKKTKLAKENSNTKNESAFNIYG